MKKKALAIAGIIGLAGATVVTNLLLLKTGKVKNIEEEVEEKITEEGEEEENETNTEKAEETKIIDDSDIEV